MMSWLSITCIQNFPSSLVFILEIDNYLKCTEIALFGQYTKLVLPFGQRYFLDTWWNESLILYVSTGFTEQSGTKPNLVAKIWPPNLVTICAWLPNLVDNISSSFHHLVNTGLAIGSLARWLPLMVAHTCKLDTIWVVYTSPIGNGSIRL